MGCRDPLLKFDVSSVRRIEGSGGRTMEPPISVPSPNGLPCKEISALSPPLLPPGVRAAEMRRWRIQIGRNPLTSRRDSLRLNGFRVRP